MIMPSGIQHVPLAIHGGIWSQDNEVASPQSRHESDCAFMG